jgi:iron complex transport system ATP-binding protein
VIALGLPTADIDRIEEMIGLLELEKFADRPVNSLSTGERSRVLFARALAARPHLLLLDEPLSNLDPYWVLRTLEILRNDASETGCAALASLHDLSQVGAFDRVLLVNQARIIADGPPAEILDSKELTEAFRVERDSSGWRFRPPVDPQSLP